MYLQRLLSIGEATELAARRRAIVGGKGQIAHRKRREGCQHCVSCALGPAPVHAHILGDALVDYRANAVSGPALPPAPNALRQRRRLPELPALTVPGPSPTVQRMGFALVDVVWIRPRSTLSR